ncbi:hypothetical protein ACTWPT_31540, partial [Nonomuraea sp. 3N208]|uniref:hypothetical protein n=1 Tax=Nonomuraea sp. 3N208 TaxID=3457421 RepID=UPI003FCF8EB5
MTTDFLSDLEKMISRVPRLSVAVSANKAHVPDELGWAWALHLQRHAGGQWLVLWEPGGQHFTAFYLGNTGSSKLSGVEAAAALSRGGAAGAESLGFGVAEAVSVTGDGLDH